MKFPVFHKLYLYTRKDVIPSIERYIPQLLFLITEYLLYFTLSYHVSITVFGNITYALMFIRIISTLIILGTDEHSITILTNFIRRRQFKKVREYISWNLNYIKLSLKLSFILGIIMFIARDPLDYFPWGNWNFVIAYLPFILFVSPIVALTILCSSYISCYKHAIVSSVFKIAFPLILLTSIWLEYNIFGHNFGENIFYILRIMVRSYVFLFLGSFLYLILTFPHLASVLHVKFTKKIHHYKWQEKAKVYSRNNVIYLLNQNIAFIILGVLSYSNKEIAYYNLALLFAKAIWMVPEAIFRLLVPEITDMIQTVEKQKKFGKKWRSISYINFSMVILMSIVILTYAPNLLIILGPDYILAMPFVYFIVIGDTISNLFGAPLLILTYTKYIKMLSHITIIRTCILGVLCILFYLYFGTLGIAIAYAIDAVLGKIFITIYTRRKIKFNLFIPELIH